MNRPKDSAPVARAFPPVVVTSAVRIRPSELHYWIGTLHTIDMAGTLRDDPPTVRFDGRARRYRFGLSAVGLSSAVLAVGAFSFGAEAAIAAFGCQKSAATVATSSGGLLSSGEKRNSVDSV